MSSHYEDKNVTVPKFIVISTMYIGITKIFIVCCNVLILILKMSIFNENILIV